jgi:hypothetical protein
MKIKHTPTFWLVSSNSPKAGMDENKSRKKGRIVSKRKSTSNP